MSTPCILVNRSGPQLDDLTVEDVSRRVCLMCFGVLKVASQLSHNTASHPSLEHMSKKLHLSKAIPSESLLREPSSTQQPHTLLNPTARTLSGGCDTYLASPPGTPYNKRCRPVLYIPALRRPCTLDIPEDLSATLVDAVFRAEVRFKTVPSEVPTEPSVSPECGLSENHEWDSWDYDEVSSTSRELGGMLLPPSADASSGYYLRLLRGRHAHYQHSEIRAHLQIGTRCLPR